MHPDDPPSIESQAAIRYRHRKAWAMTPEQRLDAAAQLQASAMALLKASPQGYQAFMARNYRQRRTINHPNSAGANAVDSAESHS